MNHRAAIVSVTPVLAFRGLKVNSAQGLLPKNTLGFVVAGFLSEYIELQPGRYIRPIKLRLSVGR